MDLSKYQMEKSSILEGLGDPSTLASSLYKRSRRGFLAFTKDRLESSVPGLVDDAELCCLIREYTEKELQGLPSSCSAKEVKPLGKKGKVGVPHVVSYPTIDGNKYIIKVSRVSPTVVYSEEPPTSIKEISKYMTVMKTCLYGNLQMSYLGTDDITNETLISFILEDLYSRYPNIGLGTGGIINHIGATICSKGYNGINLMEMADLGTLRSLASVSKYTEIADFSDGVRAFRRKVFTVSTMKSIIGQVVANLDFLQSTVDFNHGDLKVDNILVKSGDISIRYKDLYLDSRFTVKIADFGKSSLTVDHGERVRLFNRSLAASKYLWVAPFRPYIGSIGKETYYVVDSYITAQIYAQSRHMGIPFYLSFDTYTFMVSLLSIPEAYYAMFTNEDLMKIWLTMFFRDDIPKVSNRLRRAMKKGTFSIVDAIKVLKGIRLKCKGTSKILRAVSRV